MSDTATPTATATPDLESLGAEDLSFSDFERTRETGELPPKADDTPSAAAADAPKGDEPKAKTAEDPDASEDKKQDPDPADKAEDKRKGGVQRRIDQLTRDKRELEARLAALEAKPAAAAGEKPADKAADKPAETKAAQDGEPKEEDFENYRDFVKAMIKWEGDRRDITRAEDARQSEAQQAARVAQDAWKAKEDAVVAMHEDYHDVLAGCEFTCSQEEYGRFATIVHEFERGPELLYQLAGNPSDLNRILHMGAIGIARELTKLETALPSPSGKPASDQKPPAPKPRATGAPAPVTPITGGKGAAVTSLDDPNLPYEEWERRRDAQVLAHRR